jgi:hypothetical protein
MTYYLIYENREVGSTVRYGVLSAWLDDYTSGSINRTLVMKFCMLNLIHKVRNLAAAL